MTKGPREEQPQSEVINEEMAMVNRVGVGRGKTLKFERVNACYSDSLLLLLLHVVSSPVIEFANRREESCWSHFLFSLPEVTQVS